MITLTKTFFILSFLLSFLAEAIITLLIAQVKKYIIVIYKDKTKEQGALKVFKLICPFFPLLASLILAWAFLPSKAGSKVMVFYLIYFIGANYVIYKYLYRTIIDSIKSFLPSLWDKILSRFNMGGGGRM